MTTYLENDEIVLVPVPRSMLGAVYRVLGNPAKSEDLESASDSGVSVFEQGRWTEPMVQRLEGELDQASPVRGLITLVASLSPKSLTFGEAVSELQVESNVLRAQVGSLTKATKRLFGRATWPMSVRYGDAGEATYSMEPEVADWWLKAAEGA